MNSSMSWRTVDIVVTAAIAVAFGVVFWAWNALWAAATPAFLAVPPAQNILYGTWLAAGVVAGLVVQKPGAALFAELVAASVSLILGSQWGLDAALSGLFQGAGAELGFALFRYRRWDFVAALLAAHEARRPVVDPCAVGVEEPPQERCGMAFDDRPLPGLEHDRSLVLATWAQLRDQARPVLPRHGDDDAAG